MGNLLLTPRLLDLQMVFAARLRAQLSCFALQLFLVHFCVLGILPCRPLTDQDDHGRWSVGPAGNGQVVLEDFVALQAPTEEDLATWW